ncbi:hypothetical protein AXW83_14930 [Bosea sp. PAMC 26642]|nr:hypothetical protein AXW83_14930 [Bosea sp. PAMC 26642]
MAVPAPGWLLPVVAGARPVRFDSVEALEGVDQDIAIARADDWLRKHAPLSIEGDGGDATAYRVAAKVMDFGLSPDDTLDLMLGWWNDQCQPPWEDERLGVIVNNAAQYRHSPIGSSSADVEFDHVELATTSESEAVQNDDDMPVTSGNNPFEYQSAAEASAMALTQSAKPLIRGLLDQGAMSILFAPPGTGKTFVTIDLLYHIAAGKEWAGRKVTKGLAVHLAAEGGGGVRKRYKAYDVTYGCAEDLPLVLISVSADLRSNKVDCKRLIATIRAAEERFDQPCSILAIDTLSRVLAGGDENSSVDGGALVKNVDEVREALGAHIMLIHHTGKDASRGGRGWSGFKGAVDTEIEIKDGAIHVDKQRDSEKPKPIRFHLESVALGLDTDGNAVSSAIARVEASRDDDFADVLTPAQERMLAAFKSAAANKYGDRYRPGDDAFVLSSKEWDAKFDEVGSRLSPIGGRSRQTLDTHRLALLEKCLVKKIKRAQWVATQ